MSTEVLPVGIKCSLACKYCYQDPMRAANNFSPREYSVDKMIESIDKLGGHFTLFGGEALLTPIEDLHTLWAHGLKKYGQNGVQTSLSYWKPEFYEMFRKYNVHVGVSLDGPHDLNSPRCNTSTTSEIHSRFVTLIKEGYQVSLITTLHTANAVDGKLDKLCAWFNMLGSMGLKWARIHLLEVDSKYAANLKLTEDEAFDAVVRISELENGICFDMFSDMTKLLIGRTDDVSCIWNACDPLTTPAVQGIMSDGSISNCGRVNKDGINWLKSESPSRKHHERTLALYNTPEEYNGCKGCRFFFACKGECPGQSKDWRERTDHCGLLKRLFSYTEDRLLAQGKQPISLRSDVNDFNLLVANSNHHGDHYDFTRIEATVGRASVADV
jgi:uncharacterized protein